MEFLKLRLVHTEPPEIPQLQFKFSYSGTGSHSSLHLKVSVMVSCDTLCLSDSLSNLRGRGFPYVLLCLMEPRRVVHFHSVSCFICFYDGMATSKVLISRNGTQKSLTLNTSVIPYGIIFLCTKNDL